MLSKKELEIGLERCEAFIEPKSFLEQYITPAPVAADLLNLALLKGDIKGKKIFDLGCGTGRLAIGAALLGSKDVKGFDIDKDALAVARRNSNNLGVRVSWIKKDVSDLMEKCQTVIQNPPFGVKKKGADRPFILSALRAGKVIYTMHKTTTREFVQGLIKKNGGNITDICPIKFDLPHTYSFHKKRIKRIEVDIYRIERRD